MTDREICDTVRDMLRTWDALTDAERARALAQASEAAAKAECPSSCSNEDSGTCPTCYAATGRGCAHGPVCDDCREADADDPVCETCGKPASAMGDWDYAPFCSLSCRLDYEWPRGT